MFKGLLATGAICGLGASMFLLSPKTVQADPSKGSIRPLSKGEMKFTKGSGSTCNSLVCNTTSGCALGTSTYTTYYPHYQCYTSPLTMGTCNNFGTATCYSMVLFTMPGCTGVGISVGSSSVAICGL